MALTQLDLIAAWALGWLASGPGSAGDNVGNGRSIDCSPVKTSLQQKSGVAYDERCGLTVGLERRLKERNIRRQDWVMGD
jgi:hypothetical protein